MKLKLYSLIMFFMLITTNLYAFPIPDTGITKCYDDAKEIPCPTEGQTFYGQDGNYSINPMSYTKLDSTGKDLPITATTWAMVKDNVTGLIWENNSHSSTWNNAPTVIASLNNSKFGGYSDWRLPTLLELSTIIDYSIPYPGPTINTSYFKDTINSFYWSSSTHADYIGYAWGVNFYYGTDGYSKDKINCNYVRAVRGGQSDIGSFDTLIINGDGTATDTSTGLMWQQDTAKTVTGAVVMVWKDALSYCENLQLGGYTDWRLPTIKELRSIADYSTYSPAIDTYVFKDTYSSFYWSSSTDANYIYLYYAWGVLFNHGAGGNNYKDGSYYVRAVRNGQSVIPPVSNKPTVQTGTAGAVAANSATLNGTINPNGTSTTYYFQYGTSTNYGSVTPAGDAGSGTTIKTVSANITGLAAATTYHFQLVGTNTAGTVYGDDKTFTTTTQSLPENVTSYKVLTEQSPPFTISYGEYVKVFGSSGVNTITLASGAKVECVNFPGANVINIAEQKSGFAVHRSGATVYLTNATTGTLIKIPASKTAQSIKFTDASLNLVITNGKVMLGSQEVTLEAKSIQPLG